MAFYLRERMVLLYYFYTTYERTFCCQQLAAVRRPCSSRLKYSAQLLSWGTSFFVSYAKSENRLRHPSIQNLIDFHWIKKRVSGGVVCQQGKSNMIYGVVMLEYVIFREHKFVFMLLHSSWIRTASLVLNLSRISYSTNATDLCKHPRTSGQRPSNLSILMIHLGL